MYSTFTQHALNINMMALCIGVVRHWFHKRNFITAMMSMRFSGNRDKKTIICVDEGRVFLQNPQIASFLMRILMEGRSAGIGLVIAVQQPADLVKANVAEEMKTNINVNVVLGGMSPANVGHVSKFFSLDASTQEKLLELGKGSGLVMVGTQIIGSVPEYDT